MCDLGVPERGRGGIKATGAVTGTAGDWTFVAAMTSVAAPLKALRSGLWREWAPAVGVLVPGLRPGVGRTRVRAGSLRQGTPRCRPSARNRCEAASADRKHGVMMSLLFVNVLMSKQQAPGSADLQLSLVGCSGPVRARGASSCGRDGAPARTVPRPSGHGAHRTSAGWVAWRCLIVMSLQESGAQLRLDVEGRPCAGGGALMGPWLATVPEAGTGGGGGGLAPKGFACTPPAK